MEPNPPITRQRQFCELLHTGHTGPGPEAGTIEPGSGNVFKTPITVEDVMNSRMIG